MITDMISTAPGFQTSVNISYYLNNSKKIITVSYFSKRRIKEVYNKDNVDVIPIRLAKRVNFTCPSHQQMQILQQFHLQRKNYIIYTSSFWPNKNHQRLIRAFDQFKRSNPSDLKLESSITTSSSNFSSKSSATK